MARFSHHTAAGAGLRAGGIVPQRSVSINMKCALRQKQKRMHVLSV